VKVAASLSVSYCVVLCVLLSACLRSGYDRLVDQTPSAGRGGSDTIEAGILDAGSPQDAGPGIAIDATPEPDASPYIKDDGGGNGGSVPLPMDDEDAGPNQPHPIPSAGAGGAGGAAGAGAAAGAGGAGGTAGAGGAGPRSCAHGSELDGYCWFLGADGVSCNDVCQDYGGYEAVLSWIGTPVQGGSLERCDQLLTLLTSPGTTASGMRTDGLGLGCHLFYDERWWLSDPDFDPATKYSAVRLVCSCADR
jgi:hypothetical protein